MSAADTTVATTSTGKLAGKLGLVPLVALVVGSMIGGGVFFGAMAH